MNELIIFFLLFRSANFAPPLAERKIQHPPMRRNANFVSLILAQDERWRRGEGMQVVRIRAQHAVYQV